MGAWIEIYGWIRFVHRTLSLLSWERGLKSDYDMSFIKDMPSLLSWERGLKFLLSMMLLMVLLVAPLVGAWIEILGGSYVVRNIPSLLSWERGLK